MQTTNKVREQTEKLALMALLTALVAVLVYVSGFIQIGSLASLNLSLIPVVLGAAWLGPWAGAWLGGVSGIVFLLTPLMAFWYDLSVPGTVITVMLKGILSGLCAGLVYKLLEKVNRYLAVFISAIVCPVVNTGIFLLGCLVFFFDAVSTDANAGNMPIFSYMMVTFVGINFIVETAVNLVLSPAILRVLNVKKRITA